MAIKLSKNQYTIDTIGKETLPKGSTVIALDTGIIYYSDGASLKETAVKSLEDKAPTSGTYQVDWTKETFFCTLTQNTTFSEINLPLVGTKVITIYVSGDFTLTLPTTWTTGNYFEILGSYDPLQKNQIVVEYIKPNHYWIGITQNA